MNYELQNRIIILKILFILAFTAITIRLFSISLFNQSIDLKYHTTTIERRAIIIDKNKAKLAVNLYTPSLYANANKILNKQDVAEKLHNIFQDISYQQIYNKLSSTSSFIWIKRHLTPSEQDMVNKLGIPELEFKDDYKRTYPYGHLFSHLLGYVDIDGNGLAGLELYLDHQKNNSPIILSVDNRVQSIVHEELDKSISHYQALGGAGIVLDANNGEILAMVSLPDFNPHKLTNLSDNEKFNRATLGLYEFGSILKPFTAAAALDMNIVNVDTEYNVSKPLKIGKHFIKDFNPHPTPNLTVNKILVRSSNIGMARIGIQLGADSQQKYLQVLGLLSPLTIEIPEKSKPIIPKIWKDSSTASISYGYGISLTLLHTAQAIAAIVNGGKFYPATIFSQKNHPQQVIKKETSENMRNIMHEVVKSGTGRRAKVKGYDIGGKTGSGEKSINGIYQKDKNISSFIAAFPISEPQYIIAIMVDEPKAIHSKFVTGGIVAAPIVKNIINRIAAILNVLP